MAGPSAIRLTRWQPISVHRAILAGATPGQVSDAAGMGVYELFIGMAADQHG
jgi:hypothetical protein